MSWCECVQVLLDLFGAEVAHLAREGGVTLRGDVRPAPSGSVLSALLLVVSPVVYLAALYWLFKRAGSSGEDVRAGVPCLGGCMREATGVLGLAGCKKLPP